ncbi:exopolysaccharide biosynthesis protein [Saccharomonospora sp. NPDC006951]
MSDDTVRLATVGQVLRRRWKALAVLTALGALLGLGASLLFSPGYATSTSVLLQGPREPSEMLTQVEVAQSSVVLGRAAVALNWDITPAQLRESVAAEALDGNVIRITGTADSPGAAQRLADQVADEYVRFSTQLVSSGADASAQVLREQRDALRRQVMETNNRISELQSSAEQGLTVESVQTRTDLEGLRTQLGQAMTKLDEAEAGSSQANIVVMGQAERPTSPAPPTMTQLTVGGAGLFLLIGMLTQLLAARAERRLRDEGDIASALDAPVLGSVDLADDPASPKQRTGFGTRLRRLVYDTTPFEPLRKATTRDEADRDIRYRRSLARLRDSTPAGQVLVLAADDDLTAQRMAAQLAATAAVEPRARGLALRVVAVSPERVTVPDAPAGRGAVLVVVTTATRTAWELVAISRACAEAGQTVVGVVIAHRVRPSRSGAAAPDDTGTADSRRTAGGMNGMSATLAGPA